MASTSTSGTMGQMAKPEYRNWLALGHALTTVLCQGLRPFITQEVETLYRNVTARVRTPFAGPCTCVYVPRRRPNEYHDMRTCIWAKILEAYHHRNKPTWRQSDPTKWTDPVLGPWEIAKLFLPDLGGHAGIKSADDMDISNILNLMYWCNHFTIPQSLIKNVRDIRNDRCVHVPKLELADADKTVAFDAIENLLNVPQLTTDADAQKALREVISLKSITDLHSREAQILADLKEVLNERMLDLTEESERNKELVTQLQEQQEILEMAVEDLEQSNKPLQHRLAEWVSELLAFIFGILFTSLKGFRTEILFLFLFSSFHVGLDHDTLIKEGCSIKRYDDQWKLKHFDFSDFAATSRTDFIGRQWLYREMEELMEHSGNRGVLIVGNPGSGKTAFVSHLLCSRTASPLIHDRIAGYHFCMHSDKGTQNAAKFVGNLANMVASTFPDYSEIISSDSFVSRVLQNKCAQDPEWCFQEGILTPLKKLPHKPKETWFIVIDALDECSTDGKEEILSMLNSKTRRFPKWLKLIITSRNVSAITSSLDGIQILELRSGDLRNLEDIDTYSSLKVYPLKTSILQRIKTYFSIKDNNTPNQQIVTSLKEKSQGNFLFVKVVLDFLLETPESISWTKRGFPKKLGNIFQLNFDRKFSSRESFRSLREIFEVLVAAYTPLSAQDIYLLLKHDNPDLDFEYDLMPKLEEVSLFLWDRSERGLVRIYHASLSEWLTSELNKGKFYYIKKQNGHRRLAEYYLQNLRTTMKALTPEEALYLTCHIVEAGSRENQVNNFLSLPSYLVNGSDESKTTALHLSSRLVNPKFTERLTQHFYHIDCLDKDYRTPAFIAATTGCLKNLMTFFRKGANMNHTVTCADFKTPITVRNAVRECKRRTCEYSLLHIAAQEGNVDIVEFLVEQHVNVMNVTGSNNTAVQLAAANGHLEVVITLKEAGAVLDGISLHHASAGGHSRVVEYLLKEGVGDDCIDVRPFTKFCKAGNKQPDVKVHVYDNNHLKMGETALHVAARNDHPSVIESLLSYRDKSAINCVNVAGRRPLHEAVYYNNYNALKEILAAGVNTSVRCNAALHTTDLQQSSCPCQYTPLHIAAKQGYHSVAELLIAQSADLNPGDCNGSTPLHIASCHGMASVVTLLVKSGANIHARSLNGSSPFHSAAACYATSTFWPLLDLGADFFAKDSQDMTALHYIVKDIEVFGSEYFVDLYVRNPKDWIEVTLKEKEGWEKGDFKRSWLGIMIRMTKSFVANIIAKELSYSFDSIVKLYSSVFHAIGKKGNASLILTGSEGFDHSMLITMATPLVYFYDIFVQDFLERYLVTINRPYEPSMVPKQLKKALSSTLAISAYPNILNCTSLTYTVKANMARTVNTVLQAGADVNCQDHSKGTPLLSYLHSGGRHMSKVLAKHGVRIAISCDEPFGISTLHLLSYHKLHYLHYFPQFLLGDDIWSEYLKLNHSLFDYFLGNYEEVQIDGYKDTVQTGDGPLALAIKSHPLGTKILNECFDAEGFNALHRAAQGANVIAIKKFLSWGVDPDMRNSDGYSPLWLSVFYSVKYTPFLNLHRKNVLMALEVDLASMSASVILDHVLKTDTIDIGCNGSRVNLTLYHVAAIRGMWQFIAHLLLEKGVKGIDVNCPNKDGITPMYLAMLVGGTACEWRSPWCKVVEVIKSHGGRLRVPTLEAEYFLMFDLFFGMSPGQMYLELAEDEILTLQDDDENRECQGYEILTDLFKSSGKLDKLYYDYDKKIKQCSVGNGECLPEINQHLPQLESLMLVLHKQQRFNRRHSIIRHNFVRFLEEESRRVQVFLLDFTQPHSRVSCEFVENQQRKNQEQIGIAGGQHNEDDCVCSGMGVERALRVSYSDFKTSFDQLQKFSEQARSVIFSKGKLSPRVLSKIRRALHKFDTTMICDWQAIASKYLTLIFQIQNFKLGTLHANEHSRVVSITDFASLRMKEVFIKSSPETLRLALKLASDKSSTVFDDLFYLTILKFRKPPLWKGTFEGWSW